MRRIYWMYYSLALHPGSLNKHGCKGEKCMDKNSLPYRRCSVTKGYQSSNPDPIIVQAGESFHVSEKADLWDNNPDWLWVWCTDQRGKSAWVPKTIIQLDKDGQTGTTNCSY